MSLFDMIVTAVGLSMDAFAISICKGLAFREFRLRNAITVGLWFGAFQMGMPIIGYLVASIFAESLIAINHWIAFGLLAVMGGNMIRESFSGDDKDSCADTALRFGAMLPLALATSIDALAAGVTYAFLYVDILAAALTIGLTTFLFSAAGVKIGSVFGSRFQAKAERAGGGILIAMGVKILFEHLDILAF